MYVKPPERIQLQHPKRRVSRRGDSTFQDELIERLNSTDVIDSVHISDESERQSKQELASEDKKKKETVPGTAKINVEA